VTGPTTDLLLGGRIPVLGSSCGTESPEIPLLSHSKKETQKDRAFKGYLNLA
jgi:hypothetical protein